MTVVMASTNVMGFRWQEHICSFAATRHILAEGTLLSLHISGRKAAYPIALCSGRIREGCGHWNPAWLQKGRRDQRSSSQLEELALGTALCPSLWKTWMQINDKVKGWVNPSRVESCASLRSGHAKAAAWAEGRLCSVQQWPFLAGSSSEGTALPV